MQWGLADGSHCDKKKVMSYAVLHTEKGATSSGGIGNHIDRTKGKEHTFRHADPKRLDLNVNFKVHQGREKLKLSDAIAERIKEGYNGKRKIRTDAVKYSTHILTGSHERMKEIFQDKEMAQKWIAENRKFIEKEFGKENLVRFSLHLDERTPHIHAVTVPITDDGRLSARDVLGNPKAFKMRQDRYAEQMKAFGLERGVSGTGIKHENAREYYARMEKAKEIGQEDDFKTQRNVFGNYTSKSVEKLKYALKSQKTALKSRELELEKKKKELNRTSEIKNHYKNKLKEKESYEKAILLSKEFREERRQIIADKLGQKYEAQIKRRFIPNSIQNQSNEEIAKDILERVENISRKNNLSNADNALLNGSKAVKEEFERIIKHREHLDEIDRSRSRNRGGMER